MQYNYITNDVQDAKVLNKIPNCRIMIDLERLGKQERQAGTNSFISTHQVKDIPLIQSHFKGNIIVRSNPFHQDSEQELLEILKFKPQFIMIPMTRCAAEITELAQIIAGKSSLIPLIETQEGLNNAKEISKLSEVHEMYLGLNDLHLDLELKFMFEPLAMGLVDQFSQAVLPSNKPFGFGGVSTLGTGTLPAEMILLEHIRLKSSRVILSRSFKKNITYLENEIEKITRFIEENKMTNIDQLDKNSEKVKNIIQEIKSTI